MFKKNREKFIGYCWQISGYKSQFDNSIVLEEEKIEDFFELDFLKYVNDYSFGVGYYACYEKRNYIIKKPISYFFYNGQKYKRDGKYFCKLSSSEEIQINEMDTTIEDMREFISLVKDYGSVYDNLEDNIGNMVMVKTINNKNGVISHKEVYGKLNDVGTLDIRVGDEDIYFDEIYSIVGEDIHYVNPFVGFKEGINYEKYFDIVEKNAKVKKEIPILKKKY